MKSKEIKITSPNGLLVGQLFYPDDVSLESGNHPIIIFSHGFGGCVNANMGTIPALVEQGQIVYAFDFWGGGNNSKSNNDMTQMSIMTEVADCMAVIDYFKEQSWVDLQKINLMGESQGGLVTALTAVRRDDIAKIVLYYPAFVILEDAYLRHGRDLSKYPETFQIWDNVISRKYYEDVWGLDFYEEVGPYEGPVLIVHGTKDEIVPYASSEKLMKYYKNAELIAIPDAGHGYVGEDIDTAAGYAVEFLCK